MVSSYSCIQPPRERGQVLLEDLEREFGRKGEVVKLDGWASTKV